MRSMVRPGTSGSHVICKSLSKGAPEIQIQHYQLSSTPNKSQRRSFFRLFDKESLPNSDYHRFDRHPECLTSVKTRRKRYHSSVPNYANVEQSSYILEAKRRWETKRWRKYNRDGTALISSVDTTGSKPLEAYVKQ